MHRGTKNPGNREAAGVVAWGAWVGRLDQSAEAGFLGAFLRACDPSGFCEAIGYCVEVCVSEEHRLQISGVWFIRGGEVFVEDINEELRGGFGVPASVGNGEVFSDVVDLGNEFRCQCCHCGMLKRGDCWCRA